MKKIIVIGCPGSGKSTFSKAFHAITGIPLFHLDMLFWNKDKTTVGRDVLIERLRQIFAGDRWIIDGNYGSTMELRMQQCDTVIFLDYPLEVCLQGIADRKGKPRSDLPWIEPEEEDAELMESIRNYSSQGKPQVLELLDKYPDKTVFWFQNRAEADAFLQQTKEQTKNDRLWEVLPNSLLVISRKNA